MGCSLTLADPLQSNRMLKCQRPSSAEDAPPVFDVLALSNLCVDVVQPVGGPPGGGLGTCHTAGYHMHVFRRLA